MTSLQRDPLRVKRTVEEDGEYAPQRVSWLVHMGACMSLSLGDAGSSLLLIICQYVHPKTLPWAHGPLNGMRMR